MEKNAINRETILFWKWYFYMYVRFEMIHLYYSFLWNLQPCFFHRFCHHILYPPKKTTLANTEIIQSYFDDKNDEYYLDIHRPTFRAVYDYYYTGILRRPDEVPLDIMLRELRFYSIDKPTIINFLKSECELGRGLSCYSTRTALQSLTNELIRETTPKNCFPRNIGKKIGFCIVTASITSYCLDAVFL